MDHMEQILDWPLSTTGRNANFIGTQREDIIKSVSPESDIRDIFLLCNKDNTGSKKGEIFKYSDLTRPINAFMLGIAPAAHLSLSRQV
jgi:hypothetical protein